jgi:hypothetical protein
MHKLIEQEAPNDLRELVVLGLNHEQQHQELLLTDLKYTFSLNPLFPVYKENYAPIEIVDGASDVFVEVEAGMVEIAMTATDSALITSCPPPCFPEDFSVHSRLITIGNTWNHRGRRVSNRDHGIRTVGIGLIPTGSRRPCIGSSAIANS